MDKCAHAASAQLPGADRGKWQVWGAQSCSIGRCSGQMRRAQSYRCRGTTGDARQERCGERIAASLTEWSITFVPTPEMFTGDCIEKDQNARVEHLEGKGIRNGEVGVNILMTMTASRRNIFNKWNIFNK